MADPLSIGAGVLQLVVFAFEGTRSLHKTIQGFRSSSKTIKCVLDELHALGEVLYSLRTIVENPETDFSALKLPLQRCGTACRDFQKLMLEIAPQKEDARQNFRGWLKLQYMGGDINTFKESLEVYRSIVCIAIGDANLRTLIVTKRVLEEYNRMISGTTDKLEMRLERLDNNLESLALRRAGLGEGGLDRGPLQHEMASTKQCLEICAEVSQHVANAQHNVFENISTSADASQMPVATLVGLVSVHEATHDALQACGSTLERTSSGLQRHLQSVDAELRNIPPDTQTQVSGEESDQGGLKAERESTKHALAYMAEASEGAKADRVNVFEDVNIADDGDQVIISTIGDLLSVRHVSAGARSTQFMGQTSDESLQNWTKALPRREAVRNVDAPLGAAARQFEGRYGAGRNLGSQDLAGNHTDQPREQ